MNFADDEKTSMETKMTKDDRINDEAGFGAVRPGTTAEDLAHCAEGYHSWIDEVGLLPPDTKCTHCGDTYGHPD